MNRQIEIDCPQELLLGLHLDIDQFADLIKTETAISLFRDGKLSSGMAARWMGIPRVHFLIKAMQNGTASMLNDNEADFSREVSLL